MRQFMKCDMILSDDEEKVDPGYQRFEHLMDSLWMNIAQFPDLVTVTMGTKKMCLFGNSMRNREARVKLNFETGM